MITRLKRLLAALRSYSCIAIEALGIVLLPLVLIAGLTIWIWFPVLCVVCGYLAGIGHAAR